jgi:hypothetical protein
MRLRDFGCVIVALLPWTVAAGEPPPEYGVPFVENKRQWPSQFLFGAELNNNRVYLSHDRLFFLQLTQSTDGTKSDPKLQTASSEAGHLHRSHTAYATFDISFTGAKIPRLKSVGIQPTLFNYYQGNDSAQWARGARSFDGVLYEALYNGIDLMVYSQDGLLKSDWLVSPCADPSQVLLQYNGVDDLAVRDGNLHVTARLGDVIEEKPFAYQYVGGKKRQVACEYVVDGRSVSFRFPDGYDTNYELVIDPIMIFSSYSGSTADNWGNTATPDANGNLYSGGMVFGALNAGNFPVTAGAYQTIHHGGTWDVGILKYDSIGANLLYVTYLGGSGVETPQSLVVNNRGELLVLGATSSGDFPGTAAGTFKGGQTVEPLNGVTYVNGTDIFIAKLSEDGTSLLAATYLGGHQNDGINFVSGSINSANGKVESPLARNYGDQLRGDITIDDDDNIFIASSTLSIDFPLVNTDPLAAHHGGTHDAVIAKLTPNLSTLLWSRLIGGNATDVAYSIKVEDNGRLYAAGGTNSVSIPGMNGYRSSAPGNIDGWIMEISPDGSAIQNGTFIGTSSYDQVYFIDISTTGDVLTYGQTSGNYPIAPASLPFKQPGGKQFLHKLSGDLKTSVFSTTFGSGRPGPDISPTAFLVNECDNIYMAGWGGQINSPDFFGIPTNYVGGNTFNLPVTPDAYQPNSVAGNDFYMIVLTGDVELVYATYLGGTTSLTHVDGGTSRFDKRGIVYHAVCAGCRGNSDFPAVNVPAQRQTNKSTNCNNAAFKFDLSSLKARIRTNNAQLSAAGLTNVCLPNPIVFENRSIGGERYEWDLGDGTRINKLKKDTIRHHYKEPGTYVVKLIAIDVSTCIGIDSTEMVVTVTRSNMTVGIDKTICHGASTRLEAFGAADYKWTALQSPFVSSEQSPLISPEASDTYFVTMTDPGGCQLTASVDVTVIEGLDLRFEAETLYDCGERPTLHLINNSELGEDEEAYFSFGDGTFGSSSEETHQYQQDGLYHVTLIGQKEHCVFEAATDVPVMTVRAPNVITPSGSPDLNDYFKVTIGNPGILRDYVPLSLVVYDRWGKEVYRNTSYRDDWNAPNGEEGVYYYELDVAGQAQCKGWVHVIR